MARRDPILWASVTALAGFSEDGTTLSANQWNAIVGAFCGSFGSYAVWFK